MFLPSLSICVCWIDCTSGYIFCPHFCSLPLASPSHSSLECRPTVGYYCLIKGRLGRRRPDKSIKLPLAVPEGDGSRWILSQQENIPGCTSSKWCQRMCWSQHSDSNNSRASIFIHLVGLYWQWRDSLYIYYVPWSKILLIRQE